MSTMPTSIASACPSKQTLESFAFYSLDPLQLIQLEWSFRQWVKMTNGYETRLARRRILIIFLLIRYGGVTLREVLALDLEMDLMAHSILIRDRKKVNIIAREAPLAEHIAREIRASLQNPDIYESLVEGEPLLTPAAVQHHFKQRADACGFHPLLCEPENIRLARAMELQREGTSSKRIRQFLGDLAPALTSTPAPSACFQQKVGIQKQIFVRPQGRNDFAARVESVQRDTLQSQIILHTGHGHHISAIVSNDSADRLALKAGSRVIARIKPHAVSLQMENSYATSTVDNCFAGEIIGITRGRVSWECVVDIGGGAHVYSLNSVHYAATLQLRVGKKVWIAFNTFAVLLQLS